MSIQEGDRVVFRGKVGTVIFKRVLYSENIGHPEYTVRLDEYPKENLYINFIMADEMRKINE